MNREKATIIFMLVAIFLSIFFGAETWFKRKISQKQTELENARREILARIVARTESEIFLTRKILPQLRIICENKKTPQQVRSEFLTKYNIDLSLYFFNDKNRLLSSSPKRAPHLWLMKNLYPALAEKNRKKLPQYAKKLDKKIQFAFGYGKDLTSIKENPEQIIETTFDDKTGFIAWTAREKNGVIVYCSEKPHQNQIFVKEMQHFARAHGLEKAGIYQKSLSKPGHSLVERAYKSLTESRKDSGLFSDKFWFFIKSLSGKIYFASFSLKKDPLLRLLHISRLLLATLALATLFFFLFSSSALSLKFLLTSMFFASSLIPLGGIAVTTIDNIEVFEQIEANKIKAAQEETLGNIAQNFSAYLASCSATLMRLTEKPGEGQDSSTTLQMKNSILSIFPDAIISLRNSAGEQLFYHGPLVSQGRNTVFKSLARKLIERYAPERLNEHKYNGNPFSDSLVGKDDMGFGSLLNYPDMLQLVGTGNTELLLFYRVMPASAGQVAIIQIELSTYHTIKKYLESISRKRFSVDNNLIHLAAFYPPGYRWSLQPDLKKEQSLLRLAENVWGTGRPEFKKFSGKLNGYALGLRTSSLSGNCLIAFCSNEQIKASISSMKYRIALGAIIAVILLASIVLWISRQLISPLEYLEIGVKALSERRFEAKLPEPPGKDEIAQLFTAFNEMMAESYDMQIAKNVQEGLIPQTFPELPGYSMHGILREASELGGDCLDCFMIDDKKMLFLIGDITGHGVGSALIMAFSRAVTFHWSQENENSSPTTLADQIDLMLRKNKTSRMFMGVICGILDSENNKIELVVKGHIYPLLIKADGQKQWVGTPAYPLGIGKRTAARSLVVDFAPGDRLLCMTDGIIESRSKEKPLGFEGIENWAIEAFSPDAETWVSNLEKLYANWSSNVQDDDISIFAIINNGEKET
jgi:HAMP domain-containing protein